MMIWHDWNELIFFGCMSFWRNTYCTVQCEAYQSRKAKGDEPLQLLRRDTERFFIATTKTATNRAECSNIRSGRVVAAYPLTKSNTHGFSRPVTSTVVKDASEGFERRYSSSVSDKKTYSKSIFGRDEEFVSHLRCSPFLAYQWAETKVIFRRYARARRSPVIAGNNSKHTIRRLCPTRLAIDGISLSALSRTKDLSWECVESRFRYLAIEGWNQFWVRRNWV